MSLVVGLVCVAAWVAAGWWPMLALAETVAGPRWYGRVAWACALGAASVGLVQVLLSACGLASGPLAPCALAALSLIMCRWRRPVNGARGRAAPTKQEASLPRWLAVLLAGVALISLSVGTGTPFRSDGSKFWAPKARELSLVSAREAPSLHDPVRLGVHREYPLLVPALLAPVFALSPPDATAGPKLALGALGLALLGVLSVLLMRCGTRGRVLLAVFATLPLLTSADVRESAAVAGFVDGADALFLLLLVVAVEQLRESAAPAGAVRAGPGAVAAHGGPDVLPAAGAGSRAGAGVALAGLAGAALVSTKLEGAVEAGLVFGAAFLVGSRRGALLVAGGVALLLALPTAAIAAGVTPDASGFSLARLAEVTLWQARLLPVLTGLLGLLVDVSSFGLLPLLLVLLVLCKGDASAGSWAAIDAATRLAARRRRVLGLLLAGGALGFVLVSYLSTNMQAERHVDTSAHRLLWHWLPAITWLVARPHPAHGADGEAVVSA